MAHTAIELCNLALLRIGEALINDFAEGTTTADACARLYPMVRDTSLQRRLWPWAMCRQWLVRLAVSPPSDYRFYYALPSDPLLLQMVDLDLWSSDIPYRDEIATIHHGDGPTETIRVLATDAPAAYLIYLGRTGEAVWPPLFGQLVMLDLARQLCAVVTGKASLSDLLTREWADLEFRLAHVAARGHSPRTLRFPGTYETVRGSGAAAPTQYDW